MFNETAVVLSCDLRIFSDPEAEDAVRGNNARGSFAMKLFSRARKLCNAKRVGTLLFSLHLRKPSPSCERWF